MSPEEFDNRLRSTFKDEYLPPREHLWQNINTRLEQKQGTGANWYWLAPLLIAVVSGLAWLTHSSLTSNTDNTAIVAENAVTSNPSSNEVAPTSAEKGASDQSSNNEVSDNNQIPLNEAASNVSASNNNRNFKSNYKNAQTHAGDRSPVFNSASERLADNQTQASNTGSKSGNQTNNGSQNNSSTGSNASANSTENSRTALDEQLFSNLKMNFFKKFGFDFHLEATDVIRLSFASRPKVKPEVKDKVYYAGNFENNRHWINFGIGAIRAYNSFDGYMDPTYTVHKDLWSKREKLTNKGAGFSAFLTYQNKFALQGRLSYELGFNITSRSEDIKLNEYSRDIAYRSGDTIKQYQQVAIWTIMPGGDTNWYNLETPFVLVAKNRYSVVTIPFKLNYEQPISKHSFISIGAGGGISMISTQKSKHLNLVKETEFDAEFNRQIRGSLNSMVSLYTNFNSLGQLGIYCGYQMYIGSFKLNDQYGIKMGDLQYGVTFRRPLNL